MDMMLLRLGSLGKGSKHLSFILVCLFDVVVVFQTTWKFFHYSWEPLLLNLLLSPWTQRQGTVVVLFCSKSNK